MHTYIGTKVVRARPMSRGSYNEYRGWQPPSGEDQSIDGYLVEYTDGGLPNDARHQGYISWSPRDVFDRSYRLASGGLTFGQAIEALKAGLRVTRQGWNGRGMYLWLMPAAVVKAEWCRESHLKRLADDNGGEIECLGSIRMYTVNSAGRRAVLTGWLASQSDILAEDWQLVDVS